MCADVSDCVCADMCVTVSVCAELDQLSEQDKMVASLWREFRKWAG